MEHSTNIGVPGHPPPSQIEAAASVAQAAL